MKSIIVADTAAVLVATGAAAQTTSHNPAIKDSSPAQAGKAAEGRNSFTEDQARSRLTKAGYTGVGALTKDTNGVWRGTATKGGAHVQVGLDYKGNVVTGNAVAH